MKRRLSFITSVLVTSVIVLVAVGSACTGHSTSVAHVKSALLAKVTTL